MVAFCIVVSSQSVQDFWFWFLSDAVLFFQLVIHNVFSEPERRYLNLPL